MPEYTATVEVLKFFKVVQALTLTDEYKVVSPGHGCNNNDFMINITRNTMPPVRYGGVDARRKILNTTSSSIYIADPPGGIDSYATINGQTEGDWIGLYKFQDVTQYVCQSSIQINLDINGDDTCDFEAIQEYNPPGYFLAFDGYNSALTAIVDRTLQWDINSKVWSDKTPSGNERYLQVTENINDLIYITSGLNSFTTSSYQLICNSYNQSNDSYAVITSMDQERYNAISCAYNNNMFIFGGAYDNGLPGGWSPLDSCEKYNPITDTWITSIIGEPLLNGDGINICNNIMFMPYCLRQNGAIIELASYDYFIELNTLTFATYFVEHSSPDRCQTKSGFKIDEYKCLSVGGSDSLYTDYNSIDNVTAINFLGKVYSEKNPISAPVQEGYCNQYGQYSIYGGGRDRPTGGGGSIFGYTQIYNEKSDTWSFLDPMPDSMYGGSASVV